MSVSFQNEIPKARINITLNLESNGAQRKTELPLKLLVMGQFSAHDSHTPLASRERINVNRENINDVMKTLSPSLNLKISHHGTSEELPIKLRLKHLSDFHPDKIATQVPELKRLVAMRNLLKELKANLIDNQTLKMELERLIQNHQDIKQIQTDLPLLQQIGKYNE